MPTEEPGGQREREAGDFPDAGFFHFSRGIFSG
jgi:hypothetical protein